MVTIPETLIFGQPGREFFIPLVGFPNTACFVANRDREFVTIESIRGGCGSGSPLMSSFGFWPGCSRFFNPVSAGFRGGFTEALFRRVSTSEKGLKRGGKEPRGLVQS
jgi:hypothetical protein